LATTRRQVIAKLRQRYEFTALNLRAPLVHRPPLGWRRIDDRNVEQIEIERLAYER
jgi:hypothetical protein